MTEFDDLRNAFRAATEAQDKAGPDETRGGSDEQEAAGDQGQVASAEVESS